MTIFPRRRRPSSRAAVAALAFLLATAVRATAVPGITIDNFAKVNDAYFRGAQPSGNDYADLAALGIRAVIDLTGDDSEPAEQALAASAGLRYFHIPMTTHTAPTSEQITRFMAIVDDPHNQPVYVHCVGGSHRTGVMTAVYRMTHDRWTPNRAFVEMKTFKFGPDFLHAEFTRFVLGYRAPAVSAAAAGSQG